MPPPPCTFLLLLGSSSSHLPPVVLAMHISLLPLCRAVRTLSLIPAELSRRFGLLLRRPRCLHLPASAGCSPRALEKHSPSYFGWLCSFGFLVYFLERDFIAFLTEGSRPLTPCTCCFKSCPCPFGWPFSCVSPIFSASCVHLSGPLTFCLLLNVEIVLAVCVRNEASFGKCFGIELE